METNETKCETKTGTFRELFSSADLVDCMLMIFGTLGAIVCGASLPFYNLLFGRILDALNTDPSSFSDSINQLCLALVAVAFINLFCGCIQVAFWSIAGERQAQKLREKYVKAILSQEIGWFDVCGATELSTRVADLTGTIQDGISRKAGDLIQYVSQVLATFVVGFYLHWKLMAVMLVAFPLLAASGAFMISATTEAQNVSMEQYAAAGGLATESLGAFRTITALNAQPFILNKYRTYLIEAMRVGITKGCKAGFGVGSIMCSMFLVAALTFWYGATLVADSLAAHCTHNCITGGDVIAIFSLVIWGASAVGQIVQPLIALMAAKTAVAPMMEVIKRQPLIDGMSEEGLKPPTKAKGDISLQEVVFAYPSRPNIDVCQGYSLDIAAGETVALVGSSGSGKSTVVNLLLRFYDPCSGQISLDGIDTRTLNIRWLRSQIRYVGQEPVLFAGTVFENIAYGLDSFVFEEEVDSNSVTLMDRVVEAAKLANAHDFIRALPEAYQTDVGSNGMAMSGGQKQRIAIARALINRPAVLLLDEATSALDAASEKLVQQSIDSLQQSKMQTTIIIAHRLSTIRNADKIAVVHNGIIAELGTHDNLIAKDGLYADLVQHQMSHPDEDEEEHFNDVEDECCQPRTRTKSCDDDNVEADKGHAHGRRKSLVPAAEEQLSPEESKELSKRIKSLLLQHPVWVAVAFLGSAGCGSVITAWGRLQAHCQSMLYGTNVHQIRIIAAEMTGFCTMLAFIALASYTLQHWGVAQVTERVSMKLRSDLFESILRRETAFFDKKENSVGNLTTCLSDDCRTINKATGEGFVRQLQAVFTLLVGIVIGFSASWRISLVIVATLPLNLLACSIQMQAVSGQSYDSAGGEGGHGGIISSAFTHMRTISAFSVQNKVVAKYSELTRIIRDERCKRSWLAGVGFGASNTVYYLTYALLFWYGSKLIANGSNTFEQLMTANLSLMLGAMLIGLAMSDVNDQRAGLQAAKRVFKAIDEGNSSAIDGLSTTGLKPDKRSAGRIEFVNVNFCYPTRPSVQVCNNYNLTIEAGEVVALVGPSGSGKSTIMNLLLRFYDPSSGSVLLDGVDIKTLNVRWLRSQIGHVGQEPVLFQGSITSNIIKGRAEFGDTPLLTVEQVLRGTTEPQPLSPDSSDSTCSYQEVSSNQDDSTDQDDTESQVIVVEGHNPTKSQQELDGVDQKHAQAKYRQMSSRGEDVQGDVEMGVCSAPDDVIRAAKESNAHEFISRFTNKYETDVGEGSVQVSGGQKQRIAIARALINRPAVLLLDEATSALDAASEKLVQQSIDALQQSKMQTTIIIAHRLSTIRNADKIAVIDQGCVVEIGKHDELLAKRGMYWQLWNKQRNSSSKFHLSPSSSSMDFAASPLSSVTDYEVYRE